MHFNPKTLGLALLLSSSGLAAADGLGSLMAANNEVGVAIVRQNINYSELDSLQLFGSGTLDSETGTTGGYALTLSVDKDLWSTSNYLAAGYISTSGTTAYGGGVLSSTGAYSAQSATSGASTVDYWARIGTTFIPTDSTMVTPYLEYGNHTWDRNVGQNATWGYAETYSHSYAGLGVLLQAAPFNRLVLSADLFAGPMLNASIASAQLGTQSMGSPSALARIGISLDYRVWHELHLTLSLDQVQFSYSGSAANATGYLEPPSNSTLRTVALGVAYGF